MALRILLSLALLSWGVAQAGGLGSIASKFIMGKSGELASLLVGPAPRGGDLTSSIRTIRTLRDNVLEANDKTPEKAVERVESILGPNHPQVKNGNVRRLLLGDGGMSVADRVALNSIFDDMAVYVRKYKMVPLECKAACSVDKQLAGQMENAVPNYSKGDLRSAQKKYLARARGRKIDYGNLLRQEMSDLQSTLEMQRLVNTGIFRVGGDKRGALKNFVRDAMALSPNEQSKMLITLHAMTRSFSAAENTLGAARKPMFITILKFNSDNLLANGLWDTAMQSGSEGSMQKGKLDDFNWYSREDDYPQKLQVRAKKEGEITAINGNAWEWVTPRPKELLGFRLGLVTK